MIEVRYDRSCDAAKIRLVPIERGAVKRTYPCPPDEVGTMINLDFDSEGRLVGIEVLDASRFLPTALLETAVYIDVPKEAKEGGS